MIPLKTKGIAHNITEDILAKIIPNKNKSDILCYSPTINGEVQLTESEITSTKLKAVYNILSVDHLEQDDIILIKPNGTIYTFFRNKSEHNSLFITNRCNSNCLMCSQPPKNYDDLDYFYRINCQLISMIPITTQGLGITGGEPTLLGKRLINLLELIVSQLPETNLHVLTNGRSFAWKNVTTAISKVESSRILFGIPLYSDYFQEHDYIVQAKNAFNQTILGLHNMARYNLRTELRIVLHKKTYKRLPKLAQFIYKNLPFVEHIAFMGLEYTGYTPRNDKVLWIEPSEYSDQLEEATYYLEEMGMKVSIYNLPLCLLKQSLWKFSKNSISDWKREYFKECNKCDLLENCGGIFASSKKHSNEISAIHI
ncbi:His-Xaa-Ser system radical SAM maturase HxsC [Candidatus Neomarinimicrobiota bacterium]